MLPVSPLAPSTSLGSGFGLRHPGVGRFGFSWGAARGKERGTGEGAASLTLLLATRSSRRGGCPSSTSASPGAAS